MIFFHEFEWDSHIDSNEFYFTLKRFIQIFYEFYFNLDSAGLTVPQCVADFPWRSFCAQPCALPAAVLSPLNVGVRQ